MECRVCKTVPTRPVYQEAALRMSAFADNGKPETVLFLCRNCGHAFSPEIPSVSEFYDIQYPPPTALSPQPAAGEHRPKRNFMAALEAADTPYFLLARRRRPVRTGVSGTDEGALGRQPGCGARRLPHRIAPPFEEPRAAIPLRAQRPGPRIVNILRRMFLSHPSWIYCVWRTERLRDYYGRSWEAFPTGWGNDHLVLLNAILDEAVVGDDGDCFIQRIDVRQSPGAPPRPRASYAERIAINTDLLPRFRRVCRDAVAMRGWTPLERWVFARVIDLYVQKRINTSEFQIYAAEVAQGDT